MADHVEGKVAKISEKPTRNGGTIYNVCIDDGRADEWFGYGFDKPDFGEGDEIAFDIEYNGEYANIDKNTVEVLVYAAPKPPSRDSSRGGSNNRSSGRGGRGGSSRAAPSRSSGRDKPARKTAAGGGAATMSKEDWQKKDKMIQLQSAQNTAIALVNVAIANDLVSLPTKKSDKYDAYCALVDEEAERLHNQYVEAVYGKPARSSSRNSREENDYDEDVPE